MRSINTAFLAAICLAVGAFSEAAARNRFQRDVDLVTETSLRSPDGHWLITSAKYSKFVDDDARLYIEGSGLKKKELLKYFRSGKVAWSPDSRMIVFLDYRSASSNGLRVFRIENSSVIEVPLVDGMMSDIVKTELGRNELIFYYLNLATVGEKFQLRIRADVSYLLPNTSAPLHETRLEFSINAAEPRVTLVRTSRRN